jgi:hypothetical protein
MKNRTIRSLLSLIVPFLLSLTAVCIDVCAVHAVEDCDFGPDVPTTRPNREAGATETRVAVFIFDLVDIDNIRQEFTLDFFIDVEWKDQRLGELLRKSGTRMCRTPVDDVWHRFSCVRRGAHDLYDLDAWKGPPGAAD